MDLFIVMEREDYEGFSGPKGVSDNLDTAIKEANRINKDNPSDICCIVYQVKLNEFPANIKSVYITKTN